MSKLSLRRAPVRLVLSRGPWAAAWYLLVGWALFAIALSTAVAGAGLSITFAGLPVGYFGTEATPGAWSGLPSVTFVSGCVQLAGLLAL